MHMTMHANLQKLLHMVLDDIMHHLAMARPVAWVAWKLSEQRAAKQPHQRRSRYRTLQEHMPRLHHALLRFACMHFPLLRYNAHNALFARHALAADDFGSRTVWFTRTCRAEQ